MSFFCLSIPHFSAWAVTQTEPELAKKAFVVCDKGRVISASPQALDAGIRRGMPSGQAHTKCSRLHILPRNVPNEKLVWEEVQRSLYSLTSRIEPIEPGLLFAQVDATKVSGLVHAWKVQGGQATDRATARLAALMATPQEIRCVRRGREESFADRIPLNTLTEIGLSQKSLDLLKKYGYRSIGSVHALTRQQLATEFSRDAALLYTLSQGASDRANLRPVATWTPSQEIAVRHAFEMPVVEASDWNERLERLVQQACEMLGSSAAQSLEVTAFTAANPVASRLLLRCPAQKTAEFESAARQALQEAVRALRPLSPVLTGLEIRLGALAPIAVAKTPSKRQRIPVAQLRRLAQDGADNYKSRVSQETMMAHRALKARYNPFTRKAWSWQAPAEVAPAIKARATKAATQTRAKAINTIQGDISTLDTVGPAFALQQGCR